jgi:hypothetical protein
MSKISFGFVVRNLIVAALLSGMAISLTACPEGVAYSVPDGRADNHSSSNSGGSSY